MGMEGTVRARESRVEFCQGEERELVPDVSGHTSTRTDSAAPEETLLARGQSLRPLVMQLAVVSVHHR